MSFSSGTKVFLISTLAIPISYLFNRFLAKSELTQPLVIVLLCHAIGLIILFLIIRCTRQSLTSQPYNEYPFYVFALLCFISVSSLIMALELEGLISGFMNPFLKHVEPHLRSAFGAMICYWNGIVVHAVALLVIAAITWNNNYVDALCFWLGSWLNNSIVLIIGILVGKTGPDWGLLLYLPYIIIPCHTALKIIPERKDPIVSENYKPIWTRAYDLVLFIFFVFSTLVALLRGIAVLDSPIWLCRIYTKTVEPYLMSSSPAPFAKIQMLLYLFHFIPFYLFSLYRLYTCTCSKFSKLSMFHVGAALSAQITHIGSSLHSRTPYILRVPPDFSAQLAFWTINGMLVIGPILFAYRCLPEELSEISDELMNRQLARRKSLKTS